MSEDEFGDASFLQDVDLDALQAAHNPPTLQPAKSSHATTKNPYKKRKVEAANSDLSSNAESTDKENRNNKNQKPAAVTPVAELEQTLSKVFGYSQFRPGQLEAIQAILQQQDVAVFWATGSGKSLCYQIPALHTGRITMVVSPLISLMQDQVHKLNGLFDDSTTTTNNSSLATLLGSGQSDHTQEDAALRGDFALVYVTPEKLASAGFLERLTQLHKNGRSLGMFAIDESHCVSEWGHDFRRDFRQIGSLLRQHPVLKGIPVMALTATAVPRVQTDICQSLHLVRPCIIRKSFDRPNLAISVQKKDLGMAMQAAMEPLVETLIHDSKGTSRYSQQSTIVYAPTRDQVENIVTFLQQRLNQHPTIRVEGYHAGLSLADRTDAHTNFLTGKTFVIVATLAFGMGIDKPDIRRVIHFGPPKTVEEYYQQIGRAGRDGRKAECIMYVSEADFQRYHSDFYLGRLSGSAREAIVQSINALKSFSLDTLKCRRAALLDFFSEKPAFGDRCGTCNNCVNIEKYGKDDAQRDFGPIGARIVLKAVEALKEPGLTILVSVLSGKKVEGYRYKGGEAGAERLKAQLTADKGKTKKKLTQEYLKGLVAPLVQYKYLEERIKSGKYNGFSRSWSTFLLTPMGRTALFDEAVSIVLPVPESVREAERLEKARKERVLAQLEESGVQIDQLPPEEIEAGDGDAIRAFRKWTSYMETLRKNGKEDRIEQLEELLSIIKGWVAEVAEKQRMAPAAVAAEHAQLSLAYMAATLPTNGSLDKSALEAARIRTRELDSLFQAMNQWIQTHRSASKTTTSGSSDPAIDPPIQLVSGQPVKGQQWEYAIYKPVKKTGLASWESSYNRFQQGENPQTIAVAPANGRPIQARTVCGHILQGLLYGKEVDLCRLADFLPPPTASEWEQLEAAERTVGVDVCGNPVNCGVGGEKLTKTEVLRPIMGDTFVDTPFTERSDCDKEKFGQWCDKLEWYMTLKRIGFQPAFGFELE